MADVEHLFYYHADARRRLLGLGSYWAAGALLGAVRLGLFTALDERPCTVDELAQELDCVPSGLEVMLQVLVSLGLVEQGAYAYRNSAQASAYLVPGKESYLGDHLLAGAAQWPAWARLLDAMRGAKAALPNPYDDPAFAIPMARALHRDALTIGPQLARSIDISGRRRMLDVGGGTGAYAAAFCDANSALEVTLFERSVVLEEARRWFVDSPLAERFQFVEGDFLVDYLPSGFDIVLASDILHGQEPKQAQRVIGRLHDALAPGGLLILRDVFSDHRDQDAEQAQWKALFSLNLYVQSYGRCHSERDVRDWLVAAGFTGLHEVLVETEPWDPNTVWVATAMR